jgi:DNA-binding MarR family transcriptional regulator
VASISLRRVILFLITCVRKQSYDTLQAHTPREVAEGSRADNLGAWVCDMRQIDQLLEAARWPSIRMPSAEGLSPSEEALWRATMRIVTILPSQLDIDLVRGSGLTASEYITLVKLSEASNHELRMSDLANANGLSASRTTRLVDDLQRRGLVRRVTSMADARSTRARIASNGMARLRSARQSRLESVRHRLSTTSTPLLSKNWKMFCQLSHVNLRTPRFGGRSGGLFRRPRSRIGVDVKKSILLRTALVRHTHFAQPSHGCFTRQDILGR